MNSRASVVDGQVSGLKLDELELASLRGQVQEASLHIDLETRLGRGLVSVQVLSSFRFGMLPKLGVLWDQCWKLCWNVLPLGRTSCLPPNGPLSEQYQADCCHELALCTPEQCKVLPRYNTCMGSKGECLCATKQGPRFSGLQGESLSAALRWERDLVRLERVFLQQRNSRCLLAFNSDLRL